MIKIGITGGIGSGKTTVCKVFELLGVPVYYADIEAKQILDSNLEVRSNILNTFGNSVLNDEKKIDKKKLASLVFNNKENLEKLNSIVHPAVREHFENWLQQHSTQKYILKEAAILFESGSYKLVDKVIAVVAPLALKISRTMQRDKVTQAEVELRISNQLNDDEKIKRSQFVIHNDEQQLLIPQILNIHDQITKS
ncbi:MAG: dephospho-CoA kinase [Bacteroidota bacterium]|nr:dephospho-CoA kinase [Bacteroidota bacterium]